VDFQPAPEIFADAAHAVTPSVRVVADALEGDRVVPGDIAVVIDIVKTLDFDLPAVVLQLSQRKLVDQFLIIDLGGAQGYLIFSIIGRWAIRWMRAVSSWLADKASLPFEGFLRFFEKISTALAPISQGLGNGG
jgi:hypothetical protein